jgi:hypothetical protein
MFTFIIYGNNDPDITEVRDEFYFGWQDDCGASDLYQMLASQSLVEVPVLLAYRGAAQMTLANCVNNPFKKYNHFQSGKKELELAIEKDAENMEIRFIRYLSQLNLPEMLNYDNMEEDEHFIIESLLLQKQNFIPNEIYKIIAEQMIQSEKISDEEKNQLLSILSKI